MTVFNYLALYWVLRPCSLIKVRPVDQQRKHGNSCSPLSFRFLLPQAGDGGDCRGLRGWISPGPAKKDWRRLGGGGTLVWDAPPHPVWVFLNSASALTNSGCQAELLTFSSNLTMIVSLSLLDFCQLDRSQYHLRRGNTCWENAPRRFPIGSSWLMIDVGGLSHCGGAISGKLVSGV